jgi:hypothetical protein
MPVNYLRPERLTLKTHPELNERWVQERIAEDPSILGLGDLVLRDKERVQPRAGRLDLLLQDPETKRRYEVEINVVRQMKLISSALSNIGTSKERDIHRMTIVRFWSPKTLQVAS